MEENKKNTEDKIKNKYVFPNFLAKALAKVSFRAQMESSLMSMSLLIIGMFLMTVYMIFYGPKEMIYKILLIINLACGFVFLSSYLVTTYQQYKSYMDTMGFDARAEKQKIKASGNIFKRIFRAVKNIKKAKQAEKGISKIDELMAKSGVVEELKSAAEDSKKPIKDNEEMKGGSQK